MSPSSRLSTAPSSHCVASLVSSDIVPFHPVLSFLLAPLLLSLARAPPLPIPTLTSPHALLLSLSLSLRPLFSLRACPPPGYNRAIALFPLSDAATTVERTLASPTPAALRLVQVDLQNDECLSINKDRYWIFDSSPAVLNNLSRATTRLLSPTASQFLCGGPSA